MAVDDDQATPMPKKIRKDKERKDEKKDDKKKGKEIKREDALENLMTNYQEQVKARVCLLSFFVYSLLIRLQPTPSFKVPSRPFFDSGAGFRPATPYPKRTRDIPEAPPRVFPDSSLLDFCASLSHSFPLSSCLRTAL